MSLVPRLQTYRVRKFSTGKRTAYRITVPPDLAQLLEGREFVPELTDEGLLFRPIELVAHPEPDLPMWLKPTKHRS